MVMMVVYRVIYYTFTSERKGNVLFNDALNTYHGLCYTSRGALAGTRNSSITSEWWKVVKRGDVIELFLVPASAPRLV